MPLLDCDVTYVSSYVVLGVYECGHVAAGGPDLAGQGGAGSGL